MYLLYAFCFHALEFLRQGVDSPYFTESKLPSVKVYVIHVIKKEGSAASPAVRHCLRVAWWLYSAGFDTDVILFDSSPSVFLGLSREFEHFLPKVGVQLMGAHCLETVLQPWPCCCACVKHPFQI